MRDVMDFQANRGCEVFEWPYPVHYEKTIHVNTDVLVIGGGLAGMSAAIKTIATGVFLMGLLSISANQGRFKQLRADKERARKANEMYLQGLSN